MNYKKIQGELQVDSIKVSNEPIEDLDCINKKYVDDKFKEEVGAINELVDNKLDKITNTKRLYGTDLNGAQTSISYTNNMAGNVVVQRNPDGSIQVPQSKGDYHAVNNLRMTDYVDNKFNGANKAISFINYSSMVESLNGLDNVACHIGQNIMIVTLNVPDLWISEIAEESIAYTYVSDDDFVNELNTNGFVQVGYYKLSALETQKVDLGDYATKEEVGDIEIVLDGIIALQEAYIGTPFDEVHEYAQNIINGEVE